MRVRSSVRKTHALTVNILFHVHSLECEAFWKFDRNEPDWAAQINDTINNSDQQFWARAIYESVLNCVLKVKDEISGKKRSTLLWNLETAR